MRLLLLLLLVSFTVTAQTKVLYFDALRKDKVYFTWEIISDKKFVTYVIQGSNDKVNYTDLFTFKTESKKYDVALDNPSLYFRLKIYTSKDCYIYSDVEFVKSNLPIEIYPDPYRRNFLFIYSREPGTCYIYDSNNTLITTKEVCEGYNQLSYELKYGTYKVRVFTESFYHEIKLYIE